MFIQPNLIQNNHNQFLQQCRGQDLQFIYGLERFEEGEVSLLQGRGEMFHFMQLDSNNQQYEVKFQCNNYQTHRRIFLLLDMCFEFKICIFIFFYNLTNSSTIYNYLKRFRNTFCSGLVTYIYAPKRNNCFTQI